MTGRVLADYTTNGAGGLVGKVRTVNGDYTASIKPSGELMMWQVYGNGLDVSGSAADAKAAKQLIRAEVKAWEARR
jgi:hypothetical protein